MEPPSRKDRQENAKEIEMGTGEAKRGDAECAEELRGEGKRHLQASKISNPQSAIFNPENHHTRARRRSYGTGVDG
jgi:hypothetical protein